jgi:hypothetical protein
MGVMRVRKAGPTTVRSVLRFWGRGKDSAYNNSSNDSTNVPELTDTSAGSTSNTLDDFSQRPIQKSSLASGQTFVGAGPTNAPEASLHLRLLRPWVSRLDFSSMRVATPEINDNAHAPRELLFWTSESAKVIYLILSAALLLRQPILLFGVFYIVLRKMLLICLSWGGFFAQDHQAQAALKALRTFLRLILKEGNKALSGDYSRKVMAAYMIYNCTAPGESYISHVIRYKMSRLNEQFIEELQEWRERKLGYEKSTRNLFS